MKCLHGFLLMLLLTVTVSPLMANSAAAERSGLLPSLFPGGVGEAMVSGKFMQKYREFLGNSALALTRNRFRADYRKARSAYATSLSATAKARKLIVTSSRYSSAMRSVAGEMIDNHRQKAARYRKIHDRQLDVLSATICRYLVRHAAVPATAEGRKTCQSAAWKAIADSIRAEF